MSRSTKILVLGNNAVADYLSRIQAGVRRKGQISGLLTAIENTLHSGRPIVEVLADETIAGIVLTPPYSDDRLVLSLLEERKFRFVRISALLDPERGSCVMMDEYAAARAVTDLLLSRGHRRIGIMRGPNSHLISIRRYNGYASALGGKGLQIDQSLVAQGDFSRESGRAMAGKLFAARPTAIFASNDDMAAGIIDAAKLANIDIPRTISLVGYDDNPVASQVRPRLTSVRQPLEQMGEAACQILIDRISLPSKGPETVVIPHEIVERESVVEFRPDAQLSKLAG